MTAGVPPPSMPSSVPIHSSFGLTVPVPSEVAKTVVAASEPRLPRMVTVVVMLFVVPFWKLSTVRAKSWLPTMGTLTVRETVSPARVCAGRSTDLAVVREVRGSHRRGIVRAADAETVHTVEGVGGSLDQLAAAVAAILHVEVVPAGRGQRHRGGNEGPQHYANGAAGLVSHGQVAIAVAVEIGNGDPIGPAAAGAVGRGRGEGAVAVAQQQAHRAAAARWSQPGPEFHPC